MKFKKQILLPIATVAALSAAVAPIAIVAKTNKTANSNSTQLVNLANESLFEIKNGVLKGFKSTVTKEQINEYVKGGKLYLPSCKKIGAYAFKGLDLPFGTDIIISNDTTRVGDYAFYRCTADHVEFSTGTSAVPTLNTIGNYAFANCETLASFPFPKSMLSGSIGEEAFMNCKALRLFDFQADSAYGGVFDQETRNGLNNINIGTGAFTGVLPYGGVDSPIVIKIGKIDAALPAYNTFAARFTLSQFASKIQMQTSAGTTEGEWIKGETVVSSTESHEFDIATVLPTDWMEISGSTLTGIQEAYKPLMSMIPFNAISVPATVETIAPTFWEAIPEDIKANVRDLDLSNMSVEVIDDQFLWEPDVGPYITPENICLNSGVRTIGDQAFSGMVDSEEGRPSKLAWINLSELTNLESIGSEAFAANEFLACFGSNPAEKEAIDDEVLSLDFGRAKNLTLGDSAFMNTGIRNIEFTFSGIATATKLSLAFGQNVFAGLKNLISISFDDTFVYNADYADNTITFAGTPVEPEMVTQALIVLLGKGANDKHTFQDSFGRAPTTEHPNFINIPRWTEPEATNVSPETVYPDIDYYRTSSLKEKQTPNLAGGYWDVNTSGQYLQDAITWGSTVDQTQAFLNPEIWEIYCRSNPQPEQLSFEWSEKSTHLIQDVTWTEDPSAGRPFTFICTLAPGSDGQTIDRSNSTIEIGATTITNYDLVYDETNLTVSITIPGKEVKGNILATLTCTNRQEVAPTVTPEEGITFGTQPTMYEGEDVEYPFQIEDGLQIDTDASTIQSGSTPVVYGNGYDIIMNEANISSGTLLIHGWANTANSLSIDLKAKEQTKINTDVQFDASAFALGTPVAPTDVVVGQNMTMSIDGLKYNENYGFSIETTYALCKDDKEQTIDILYFEEAVPETSIVTKNVIPADTTQVLIMFGTSNIITKAVNIDVDPTAAWDKPDKLIKPAFIIPGQKVTLPLQEECLKFGYYYNLEQTIATCQLKGGETKILTFEKGDDGKTIVTRENFPNVADYKDVSSVTIRLGATAQKLIDIKFDYNSDDFTQTPSVAQVRTMRKVILPIGDWQLEDKKAVDVGKTTVACYSDTELIDTFNFEGSSRNVSSTDVIPNGTTKVIIHIETITKQASINTVTPIFSEDEFTSAPSVPEPSSLSTGDFIRMKRDDEKLQSGYLFDVEHCSAVCKNSTDDTIGTLKFAENEDEPGYIQTTSTIPVGTEKIEINFKAKMALPVTPHYSDEAFNDNPGIPTGVGIGDTVSIDISTAILKMGYTYNKTTTFIECTLPDNQKQTINFNLIVNEQNTGKFVAQEAIPTGTTKVDIYVGSTTDDIRRPWAASVGESSKEYLSGDGSGSVMKYDGGIDATCRVKEGYTDTYEIDLDNTMIKIGSKPAETKSITEWQAIYQWLKIELGGKQPGDYKLTIPLDMIVDSTTTIEIIWAAKKMPKP